MNLQAFFKSILTLILTSVSLIILLILIRSQSVHKIPDAFFISGGIIFIGGLTTIIVVGGTFDSMTYSFSKLKYYMFKKSYLRNEHETDVKEINKNKSAPERSFYEYKLRKQAKRTDFNPYPSLIIGAINILISFII